MIVIFKRGIGKFWGIVNFPLMYLGLQLLVSLIYTIIAALTAYFGAFGELVSTGTDLEMFYSNENAFQSIADMMMNRLNIDLMIPMIISGLLMLMIAYFIMRKRWRADSFFSPKRLRKTPVILCVLFGVALNWLTVGIIELTRAVEAFPSYDETILKLLGDNFILNLLGAAVLAPIVEEIIFRGIIQNRLKRFMPLSLAVIIQAALFGLIHMNVLQGLYAGVLGVLIGVIYVWYDSIYIAVIIHIAYNATSLIMSQVLGDVGVSGFQLCVMTAAGFVVSLLAFVLMLKKRQRFSSAPLAETEVEPIPLPETENS